MSTLPSLVETNKKKNKSFKDKNKSFKKTKRLNTWGDSLNKSNFLATKKFTFLDNFNNMTLKMYKKKVEKKNNDDQLLEKKNAIKLEENILRFKLYIAVRFDVCDRPFLFLSPVLA